MKGSTPQIKILEVIVPGTPAHMKDSGSVESVAGSYVSVFSGVVPSGKTRNVYYAIGTCSIEGKFRLKAGSDVIASGRTAPGNPNWIFPFTPPRGVSTGVTIELEFCARPNSPPAPVEGYAHASDV